MNTSDTLWPPNPNALFSTAIGSEPRLASGLGSVATSALKTRIAGIVNLINPPGSTCTLVPLCLPQARILTKADPARSRGG